HTPYLSPFPTRRSSDLLSFSSMRLRLNGFGNVSLSKSARALLPASSLAYAYIGVLTSWSKRKAKKAIFTAGSLMWTPSSFAPLRSEEHTSELQSLAYLV